VKNGFTFGATGPLRCDHCVAVVDVPVGAVESDAFENWLDKILVLPGSTFSNLLGSMTCG